VQVVVKGGAALLKVAPAAAGALRSGAVEGSILFGQKRIAPTFRLLGSKASDAIRGKTLVEVAEGLRNGAISADELPIEYFVRSGQRIAVNNRGLAALRMAGMEPTITREVVMTQDLFERLSERAIDSFHKIPGGRIAVTLNKDGTGHLYTVLSR
jgi:hypothetical protein